MNNNYKKEIECLYRLQGLNGSFDEISDFLVQQSIIPIELMRSVRLAPEIYKAMHKVLKELSTSGKLQLLEYEWTILPVERIKILLVTDKTTREFTYNF